MDYPEHGANPKQLYKNLNLEVPRTLVDFSENVNPAGPPEKVSSAWQAMISKITAYPHPDGEPFLSAVSKFHQIPTDFILAGNGAAELLALLAERYRGEKAIVVHPTFSEYEATLKAKNVSIIRVIATEEEQFQLPLTSILREMEQASVLYLCTPNNPTGLMPDKNNLHKIIQYGKKVHCEIVLDEAFIDFIDESLSYINEINKNPHVIIVRSMTKMYAIPGIRLGYLVANPLTILAIKKHAPHWNVNGIAAEIGAICLEESHYRKSAIAHSVSQRESMQSFLKRNDCIVTDAKANFLSFTLKEGRDIRKLYRDLLARGIVLRHSENFLGMDGRWLRIGMKLEEDMAHLKKEMHAWFLEN